MAAEKRKMRVFVGFLDASAHDVFPHVDAIRKQQEGIVKHLASLKPSLAKRGIELEVVSGHYVLEPNRAHKPDLLDPSSEYRALASSYDRIGKRIAKDIEKFDLALFVGGFHHAARPLYSIPGKVLRMDAHRDESGPKGMLSFYFGHGSYVPVDGSVKAVADISHFGLSESKVTVVKGNQFVENPPPKLAVVKRPKDVKADIFDIDIDAVKGDFTSLVRFPETPRIAVGDIEEALFHSEPKVVGLFEAHPTAEGSGLNQRLWNHLAYSAVLAKVGERGLMPKFKTGTK